MHNLALASATIKDMQTRQRDVAALDAKYTGELEDAKATIAQLERDVASGKRRLQVNARCTANGQASTCSMGDASSPRLVDSAERDYFTLRERIETVTKRVGYLQEYIIRQCQLLFKVFIHGVVMLVFSVKKEPVDKSYGST